jgi:hypothetical protein
MTRFVTHGQRPGGADQRPAQMPEAQRSHIHGALQPMESTNPLALLRTSAALRRTMLREFAIGFAVSAPVLLAVWLFAAATPA